VGGRGGRDAGVVDSTLETPAIDTSPLPQHARGVRMTKPAVVLGTAALLLGMVFLWHGRSTRLGADSPPQSLGHPLRTSAGFRSPGFPKDAGLRSQGDLRHWAKALDDATLAKVAGDLVGDLLAPAGLTRANTKCLAVAVFQEWGLRDADAAAKLLQEAAGKAGKTDDWTDWVGALGVLRYAACLGRSEVNAGDAWHRLVRWSDLSDRMSFVSVWYGVGMFSQPEDAYYGLIFRRVMDASPETAAQFLRNRFDDRVGKAASANAMRAYHAAIADPQRRADAFHTFTERNLAALCGNPVSPGDIVRTTSKDFQIYAGDPKYRPPIDHEDDIVAALSGIAEHDPDQALRLLGEVVARIPPPEFRKEKESSLTRFLFVLWARHHGEAASRMLERRNDSAETHSLRKAVAEEVFGHQPDLALGLMEGVPTGMRKEFLNDRDDLLDMTRAEWWPSPEHDSPPPDWEALRAKLKRALANPAAPPPG